MKRHIRNRKENLNYSTNTSDKVPFSSQQEKVALLKKLVDINSNTSNIEGVNRVQSLIKQELRSLGFSTSLIDNPLGPKLSAKFLIGERKGIVGKSFITFVTHADTVHGLDSSFQKLKLNKAQDTATGPGAIDDKGGIVVALSGISKYLFETKNPLPLRFICSPSEEVGSTGFEALFMKISKDTEIALGFEPALDDGSIINGRWGNRWYHIIVEGRKAHAGRAHEYGANAAHELAIKLDKLQRLTNYQKMQTVSIGSIEGGDKKFNVVCDHAEGRIDVRFPNTKIRDLLDKKIFEILNKTEIHSFKGHVPTSTKAFLENDCPPFAPNASSDIFASHHLKILATLEKRHKTPKLNKRASTKISKGASDLNIMSRPGLIALDGLGAWGGKMHSNEEFIFLDSLHTRSQALSEILHFIEDRL